MSALMSSISSLTYLFCGRGTYRLCATASSGGESAPGSARKEEPASVDVDSFDVDVDVDVGVVFSFAFDADADADIGLPRLSAKGDCHAFEKMSAFLDKDVFARFEKSKSSNPTSSSSSSSSSLLSC